MLKRLTVKTGVVANSLSRFDISVSGSGEGVLVVALTVENINDLDFVKRVSGGKGSHPINSMD